MVQIPIKLAEGGWDNEWTIIELQGDLEARSSEDSINNKFLGDLLFTKEGTPMLILGHHVLYGVIVDLEKPLAVAYKTKVEKKDEAKPEANVEYIIKAVVKRKLLFNSRPRPIVANVAKKV